MYRMLAALMLVLVTTMSGCSASPHVEMGGGESVVLTPGTGQIDVQGHLVNTGDAKARDVELFFKFSQNGVVYLEKKILLGNIHAGDSSSFNGVFFGPPVTGVFGWEYRIEWD